jgi:hypothetical protein
MMTIAASLFAQKEPHPRLSKGEEPILNNLKED